MADGGAIGQASGVRFGLVDHTETRDDRPLSTVYAEHTQLAKAADEAGLWGYHTTEHHLSPFDATPSPSVYLAALAPQTHQIQLGSLVHIVPGYHPVRLAEEVIMLDHLSNGRLQMGVGKGVNAPEQRLLDVDTETVDDLFLEHLERMVGVLEGTPVDGAPIPFTPLQQPYPPLWYAGNAARAAELNLHVIIGGSAESVADQVKEHRRIQQAESSSPLQMRYNPTVRHTTVGVTRQVLVDRHSQRARSRAVESWQTFSQHLTHHFDRTGERSLHDPASGGDAARAMAVGAITAGSPQQVAEAYIELAEAGADYLLGVFFWGNLDLPDALSSFELFVTDVIPAVEASLAGR